MIWIYFFCAIGLLWSALLMWSWLKELFCFAYYKLMGSRMDFRRLSTAVITGASDGIGKAYAFELARLGLKRLVLISRSEEKLQNVAKELSEKYPKVDSRIMVIDFDQTDVYGRIEKELSVFEDIDVLVNNVGANINAQTDFHQIKRENIFKMVNINILPVLMLSQMVIKQMISKNRKGVIINVSSANAELPPFNPMYAPSKIFVNQLSWSLRMQYQKLGFTIQEVEPMLVRTKMARFVKGFFVPTPEEYVRDAIQTLGHYGRTFGTFRHMAIGNLLKSLPFFFVNSYNEFLKTKFRKAAEKKQGQGQNKTNDNIAITMLSTNRIQPINSENGMILKQINS